MSSSDLDTGLVQIIESLDRVGDRYVRQRAIGDGCGGHFSLTFRAVEESTGEQVVLKFLRPSHGSPHGSRVFEREISICRRLIGRDNIVQLRGGPDKLEIAMTHPAAGCPVPIQLPYYALEAARENFESYLLMGRSPGLIRRLEVVRDVVRGVNRLHAAGYCHRDLKPDNILLFSGGEAKLGDLGTCRLADMSEPPLNSDYLQPPGHILYAAPELLFGGWNSRALYRSADWFGVGAILFEALTGANLYTAIGLTNDLSAILDTFQPMAEAARLLVYDRHVQRIAGEYPIPSIRGFASGAKHLRDASSATLLSTDSLLRMLCHFDHRRRLTNFESIMRRMDICLGHARNDERRRARSLLRGSPTLA